MPILTAYRDGYDDGYFKGDLAPEPMYKGQDLVNYHRGKEQGKIDWSVGLNPDSTRGEMIEQRPTMLNDFIHAAWMMEDGGSFARHIGSAYMFADADNRKILREAFPVLFHDHFNKYLREQQA